MVLDQSIDLRLTMVRLKWCTIPVPSCSLYPYSKICVSVYRIGHRISVDGNWGLWGNWSDCSKTCGEGLKNRTRKCNNPEPMYGGRSCDGSSADVGVCIDKECPGM